MADVIISDLRAAAVSPEQLLIDRLPDPIRIPAMVLGFASVGLTNVVLFVIGTVGVVEGLQLEQWKRRNMSEFAKYIEGLKQLGPSEKKLYVRQPYTLPKFLWAAFEGEKLKITTALFDSLLAAVTIGPLLFLMALSSTLVLASAILR